MTAKNSLRSWRRDEKITETLYERKKIVISTVFVLLFIYL